MKEKIIKCRSCGKEIVKWKKCHSRINYCCDCNNRAFGCYRKPLFRYSRECQLDYILNQVSRELGNMGDIYKEKKDFGFSIEKITEEWKKISLINPFDETTPFYHRETEEEFKQRMEEESKIKLEPPFRKSKIMKNKEK